VVAFPSHHGHSGSTTSASSPFFCVICRYTFYYSAARTIIPAPDQPPIHVPHASYPHVISAQHQFSLTPLSSFHLERLSPPRRINVASFHCRLLTGQTRLQRDSTGPASAPPDSTASSGARPQWQRPEALDCSRAAHFQETTAACRDHRVR